MRATVEINGARVAEATGAAVLGDPLRALVWLANKLPEYGYALRAGQLVMTGSLTRQFAVSEATGSLPPLHHSAPWWRRSTEPSSRAARA